MNSVAIGFVHGGMVHTRFMLSVHNVVNYEEALLFEEESGPCIAGARNRIVQRFLDSDREWLYSADTDTVFDKDIISRLIKSDKHVIGGLLLQKGTPPFPMMYERMADVSFDMPMLRVMGGWQNRGLVKVDVIGAGSMLIHRGVFEKIAREVPNKAAQWFQETAVGASLVSEDVEFCFRVARVGCDIYVDPTVRIGHLKVGML